MSLARVALRLSVPLAALAALAGCSSSSSAPGAAASKTAASSPSTVAPASPVTTASPATSAATNAAAPASATAGATAAPRVYFADGGSVGGRALFEPACTTACLLSGDSTAAMVNMTWSSWTGTQAVGRGTEKIDDCNPNCAAGTAHPVAVTVTFSKPVSVPCRGGLTRRYWTKVAFAWPDGLPAALRGANAPASSLDYNPGLASGGSCG